MPRKILIWVMLAAALLVPLGLAATSPFLAWRSAVYIAAGFAGIIAMGLLLVQPVLAGGFLPGLTPRRARQWHAWVGGGLVLTIIAHVVGLWMTSAPDVIDALLFRSPTPFSDWGVIAMWAVFAAALLAALRRRLRLHPATWRICHLALVTITVGGTVAHALLIEGTMEMVSKIMLSVLVIAALAKVVIDVKPWKRLARRKA